MQDSSSFNSPMKKVKTYYLKYFEKTVALIDEENEIPVSMEVVNPSLFFDRFTKNLLNKDQIKVWIINRLRPQSQVGFDGVLKKFNVYTSESDWYWKLFKATKGVNVKDRLWLSEEDLVTQKDIVWNSITLEHTLVKNIEDVADYNNLLSLFKTRTIMNIDGACEKDLVRINGHLSIVKRPLQHNTYDCVAEEICYHLAKMLGLRCSVAGFLNPDLCYSVINEDLSLIHACDFLGTDDSSVQNVYSLLKRKTQSTIVKTEYLRMVLFDLITRQLDRNLTNFGFHYVNGELRLYDLYDNGLSLFSSSKFNKDLEFYMGRDKSSEVLSYVVREFNLLGVSTIFNGTLHGRDLTGLLMPYEDYVRSKNGNDVRDVSMWVMRQSLNVLTEFDR